MTAGYKEKYARFSQQDMYAFCKENYIVLMRTLVSVFLPILKFMSNLFSTFAIGLTIMITCFHACNLINNIINVRLLRTCCQLLDCC